MDPHLDQILDGEVLVAEIANRLDELRRDAVDAHRHELVERQVLVAELAASS